MLTTTLTPGNALPTWIRLEPCLVACLWLDKRVVAAAALRLTFPTTSAEGNNAAHRLVASPATHLQVIFQATAPLLQRRGLGRLLMRCVMLTAVEAGHQYFTALVSKGNNAHFWTHMGFTEVECQEVRPGELGLPRGWSRGLKPVLQESWKQSLFTVNIWYGERPKQVVTVDLKDEVPQPQPSGLQQEREQDLSYEQRPARMKRMKQDPYEAEEQAPGVVWPATGEPGPSTAAADAAVAAPEPPKDDRPAWLVESKKQVEEAAARVAAAFAPRVASTVSGARPPGMARAVPTAIAVQQALAQQVCGGAGPAGWHTDRGGPELCASPSAAPTADEAAPLVAAVAEAVLVEAAAAASGIAAVAAQADSAAAMEAAAAAVPTAVTMAEETAQVAAEVETVDEAAAPPPPPAAPPPGDDAQRPLKRPRCCGDSLAGQDHQPQEQQAQQPPPSPAGAPAPRPGDDDDGAGGGDNCVAAATPGASAGAGHSAAVDGACLQASPPASPLMAAPCAPHEAHCSASPTAAAEDGRGGAGGAAAAQGSGPGAAAGAAGLSCCAAVQSAQLREALAVLYPSVLHLLRGISQPHSSPLHGPGAAAAAAIGLPALPLEVLQRYASSLGWNYRMVIMPACMPGTGSAGGYGGAAVGGFKAILTLHSSDESASAQATGKVAADVDTAEQLAAASYLQHQLAAGVGPDRLWPPSQQQQRQPPQQHTPEGRTAVDMAAAAQHGAFGGPSAAQATPQPGSTPAAAFAPQPCGHTSVQRSHHTPLVPSVAYPSYSPWPYPQPYAYCTPPLSQQQPYQQQHGAWHQPGGPCASAAAAGAPAVGAAAASSNATGASSEQRDTVAAGPLDPPSVPSGGAGGAAGFELSVAPPPQPTPPPPPQEGMPPHGVYPAGYYWPPPAAPPMQGYGGPYAPYPQPPPGSWGPPPAGMQWPQGAWQPFPSAPPQQQQQALQPQ
ncbi:hypothetical protein HXX76_014648 [Chlamydomonas incerta]|uniref:N-acetyltransferase domain-containing protein n=1 Tax=Chlamydomonas incerta TaxID=51695 RepID=A0A835SC59_CHLIN|nr:hypothetical protein HXX76_014648 [Chlamydomonas incerta]|eukprot:KAG2424269.1 hypothetical protein HXX76_014648 [Chlamydomonas incerta]